MKTLPLGNAAFLSILLAAGFSLAAGSSAYAGAAVAPGLCAGEGCLAGDPMEVIFDEFGKAAISQNSGPFGPLAGGLGPDPTAGTGGAPVLIYKLPQQVISGTVFFTEPGAGTGVYSDALRFTTSTGDGKGLIDGGVTGAGRTIMIFYSDIEPGETNLALADTGIPAIGGNFITRAEVGCETCLNGFDYRPAGVPYPGNNEYVGISDYAVPELATWAMMGVGFAGLAFAGYRRAKAKVALAG
jgi:hypothetical protein